MVLGGDTLLLLTRINISRQSEYYSDEFGNYECSKR